MTTFNSESFSLKGKVALITGGARGLGKYYSTALSMYGADIFIVSDSETGWPELKNIVEANNQRIEFLKQDITEEDKIDSIVAEVINRFGHLDILINNAGIQLRNDVLDFKNEDWKKVINLNLNALYFLSHSAAKVMAKQKYGKSSILVQCSLIEQVKEFFHIQPVNTQCWG